MKISIITVCYNSEKFIEQTIKSVAVQTCKNIEYIIIDGKSVDRTLEIIDRYSRFITHFVSEPDGSMYDALNKGLSLTTGDYILNLNSDDFLNSPTVIEEVVRKLGNKRPDAFYCDLIKSYGKVTKKIKHFSASFLTLLCSRHGTFVPHPVFFIAKHANEMIGGYDLSYKYASDFDYILKVLQMPDVKVLHLPIQCVTFRMHAESYTGRGKITLDRLEILKKFGYYEIPLLERKARFYFGWGYYLVINFWTYVKFTLQKKIGSSA